ncbi:hypothetical protein CVT25_011223 [Psilocybe cyanescens]|uniref:Uncharacterized protein n=1 Tax=Psilocybe cyanescens TaxID=93625 RepID=A0A409XCF3_PSICY|nr:hypothetical protein CVT25_011223 [Psilocybe cyanescens]
MVSAYTYFVIFWCNEDKFRNSHWSLIVNITTNSIAAFVVQGFLTYRYWKLSSNKYTTSVIFALMLFGWAGDIHLAIRSSHPSRVPADRLSDTRDVVIALAGSAATDITITVALIWALHQTQTFNKVTKHLVRRIMNVAIVTGSVTSIAAIIVLITFLIIPLSRIPTCFALFLGRIYTLSMLYVLIHRDVISQGLMSVVVDSDALHSTMETACNTNLRGSVGAAIGALNWPPPYPIVELASYTFMLRKLKSLAHIPITRKDGLELKDIETAFKHISKELSKELAGTQASGQAVRILVSGGTCSVMYFGNRDKTKDIDFFIPDPALIEMIAGSQASLPFDLQKRWPENWINAEMAGFAMMPGCEDLYKNSIANNVVLYQSDTLVAYAADWRFQLIGKITRAYQMELLKEQLQSRDREGKDLKDAVSLLQILITQNNGPLDRNVVRSWYNGSALEDVEIEFVNKEYRAKFNVDAIL